MSTYNDYGIVLSSYNLQETDKILNIYTKDSGLVRAVGKGLKKPNSKFSGKVDQLSCCYFQFAKGKNLDVICDCEQMNSFPKLRSDLVRLTSGLLFLEIVLSFAHEKESESNQVYELLYSCLEELQMVSDPILFSVKFVVRFLSIHGLKPQLETCVYCSRQIRRSTGQKVNRSEIGYPYSSALGGLLCDECGELMDHKLVPFNVLEIINNYTNDLVPILDSSLDEQKLKIQNLRLEDIRCALDLLREHIDVRAKSKIKSFDLVFSL